MGRKTTGDLREELINATNLDRFLVDNGEHFNTDSASAVLRQLVDHCGMTKAAIAKKSGMSEVYLYLLLAGRRTPSREKLLCLCLGMGTSLKDVQRLLRGYGYSELYARDRKDAIMLYGLTHGMSLFEVNDKLFMEKEELLY